MIKDIKLEDWKGCPYCGGKDFFEGPSGGLSINILCANKECRHWFNDMGPFGVQDLDRVEPIENLEGKL